MKKVFLSLLLMVASPLTFAQMQVWSNGTIIFSHNANDVDSISFSGSPMRVQANTQETISSLAGCVYTSSLAGIGDKNSLDALFFLDNSTGYYGHNERELDTPGSPGGGRYNNLYDFSYTISGVNITLTFTSPWDSTIQGKIIGKNGIVFFNWSTSSGNAYPASFISLIR